MIAYSDIGSDALNSAVDRPNRLLPSGYCDLLLLVYEVHPLYELQGKTSSDIRTTHGNDKPYTRTAALKGGRGVHVVRPPPIDTVQGAAK